MGLFDLFKHKDKIGGSIGYFGLTDVDRITESLTKCQYLMFNDKFSERMERLQELYMESAQIVSLD